MHYLPIVTFKEWLLNDYWFLFRKLLLKNLKGSINQLLHQNKLSKNLLDLFKISDIEAKFINKINPKQKDKFIELVRLYDEIINSPNITTNVFLNKLHQNKSLNKLGSNIIKDLTQNNRREFYLLEDWGNTNEYYVVLLREIQKISWEVGKKIGKGLNCDDLSVEDYNFNNIKNVSGDFICPQIAIKAPFLEHLIQKFFQNFGRIGISDHHFELNEKLIKETILI